MGKIKFIVLGVGWRTKFFIRIARAMPEQFEIIGLLTRNDQRAKEVESAWQIPAYSDLDQLIAKTNPSFAVVSLPRTIAPDMTKRLVEKGIPVLTETPPAADLKGLIDLYPLVKQGAKIQVAEQYAFQPLHEARIKIARSGLLGNINQVQLSVCHDYHAMSLIRKLFGITYENATISGRKFTSPIINGPDWNGDPESETVSQIKQTVAWLEFGDQSAEYDFFDEQYFSWIRALRFLVRGDRGEIHDERVRYLKDYKTPVQIDLKRINAGENGNLEGYFLRGIMSGPDWVYENPFMPARLTDDEIAIATSLYKMEQYVNGGPEVYSLAEASQDHYLALTMAEAVRTGQTIKTETQIWAK